MWTPVDGEWYCSLHALNAVRTFKRKQRALEDLQRAQPKAEAAAQSIRELARSVGRLMDNGLFSPSELGSYVRRHYPEQAAKLLETMEAERKTEDEQP